MERASIGSWRHLHLINVRCRTFQTGRMEVEKQRSKLENGHFIGGSHESFEDGRHEHLVRGPNLEFRVRAAGPSERAAAGGAEARASEASRTQNRHPRRTLSLNKQRLLRN